MNYFCLLDSYFCDDVLVQQRQDNYASDTLLGNGVRVVNKITESVSPHS